MGSACFGGLLALKSLKNCKKGVSLKGPYENNRYQKEGREFLNSWFKKISLPKVINICNPHEKS